MTGISKPNNMSPGAVIAWAIVGLVLLITLAGLITLFAWNTGVVAALGAFGVAVGQIGFIDAVAINFAIGAVGRIFRPAPKIDLKGKD